MRRGGRLQRWTLVLALLATTRCTGGGLAPRGPAIAALDCSPASPPATCPTELPPTSLASPEPHEDLIYLQPPATDATIPAATAIGTAVEQVGFGGTSIQAIYATYRPVNDATPIDTPVWIVRYTEYCLPAPAGSPGCTPHTVDVVIDADTGDYLFTSGY